MRLPVRIGLGRVSQSISGLQASYRDASRAVWINRRVATAREILYWRDVPDVALIAGIPFDSGIEPMLRRVQPLLDQKDGDELVRLVFTWCESRFSIRETADRLFVHSNTVKYRLDRIERLTGMDPRDFSDCMALYVTLMLCRLNSSDGKRVIIEAFSPCFIRIVLLGDHLQNMEITVSLPKPSMRRSRQRNNGKPYRQIWFLNRWIYIPVPRLARV